MEDRGDNSSDVLMWRISSTFALMNYAQISSLILPIHPLPDMLCVDDGLPTVIIKVLISPPFEQRTIVPYCIKNCLSVYLLEEATVFDLCQLLLHQTPFHFPSILALWTPITMAKSGKSKEVRNDRQKVETKKV